MEELANTLIEFLFLKNGVVAIPIFSTLLVLLFKAVSYRAECDMDSIKAMCNIGLDLATSGIFVLLTNISFLVKAVMEAALESGENVLQIEGITDGIYTSLFIYGTKITIYLVVVLIFSLLIRIFAWSKNNTRLIDSWPKIILIDFVGILLLVVSIVFAGGNLK